MDAQTNGQMDGPKAIYSRSINAGGIKIQSIYLFPQHFKKCSGWLREVVQNRVTSPVELRARLCWEPHAISIILLSDKTCTHTGSLL